ncbi:hypothetical protein BRC81_01855 [Halobacteriales archaeon QS_1_68_20]|nr:MAG: hypothetical protein BRC81_01855 [Halobacteriales archaeon QS_1_68_20]
MFETLSLSEPRNDVYRLRLERRSRLNAINEQMIEDLQAATDRLAAEDPDAVVLAGAGSRSFSIGMDTRAPIARRDDQTAGESVARQAQEVMDAIESLSAPVMAAVDGLALGGGLELALTADVRIGGESSEYGLPEITHGLIPGAGATQRLPAIVGRGRAYEMMFTGEKYDAEEMADWGLLAAVVPDDEVVDAALDRAEELAGADAGSDEDGERVLAPGAGRVSEGFMLEQSGLGQAFSRDPFDAASDDD